MDLDKEFVRAVLNEGDKAYRLALERGIGPDHLLDEGKIAWSFVLDHHKKYGVIPSKELLIGSLVDARGNQIDLSAGLADTAHALIDKVCDRRIINILFEGTRQVTEKLAARNAKEASEAYEEIRRKLLNEQLTVSRVESMFALGTKVMEYYEMVKAGNKGIPTPWPTMDDQTMGWWPEDLILFVGRMAVGKTWVMLLATHAAWRAMHKVLFVSTEMAKEKLAARFICLHLRIPYEDYRKGRLGDFVEKKMRDGIDAMLHDQGVDVVGGDFDFSIDSLEAAVEDTRPELLMVDGSYLIKNHGKDRHERVSNTFDDLKRISKKKRISTIANLQFNRSAKAGQEKTIAAENIGITDVAGWNADAAYGLNQSTEMRDNCQMGMKPLKIREGKPQDFLLNWDLNKMDFSEIREADGSAISPPDISLDGSDEDLPDIPF